MSHQTPRVFLARHGETEWTISGQHTGTTDIPLTALGERQVISTGSLLVGQGKLIDPKRVVTVWSGKCGAGFAGISEVFDGGQGSVIVTEEIAEWDYGEYEGMKPAEVRAMRREKGIDKEGMEWSVWRDGCEGGESKDQVEARLDRLIKEIKEVQRPYMHGKGNGDVVLVAHGLILRCFVKRWLRLSLDDPLPMTLDPGAIAVLSYKNHSVEHPTFHVGIALPVAD